MEDELETSFATNLFGTVGGVQGFGSISNLTTAGNRNDTFGSGLSKPTPQKYSQNELQQVTACIDKLYSKYECWFIASYLLI